MKKTKVLRVLLPLAFMAIIAVGFLTHGGIGTLSALGWKDVAILCPLGALATMLASKTLIPRALIAFAVAIVAILLLGRAFCAWVCPVPVVSKLREAFSPKKKPAKADRAVAAAAMASAELEAADEGATAASAAVAPLTDKEKLLLKKGCSGGCGAVREKIDTRHFVLGGALLSSAIFGFPVFCLVCPIGLTFAAILLLIRAFGFGDPSITLLVVITLLLVEVVFFKKWCHKICPLGALMSLVSKGNKTFRPAVDASKCLETAKGVHCSACAKVCPEGINLHELGTPNSAALSECTKCRACVDVCPTNALTLPFLATKDAAKK